MFRRLLPFLILILAPMSTEAALVINEIAWMGSAESANDEWIELYNDGGDSISVDGWVLTDGMNLEIELTGAVGAGQYAVLERTDDQSAPGSAFLIYTGALPNTGATLRLERSDGSLEDQVAGGEDWENIGGDNTTKETAQLTSGGWVTGSPTSGRANVAKASEPEPEEETRSVSAEKSATNTTRPKTEKKTVTLSLPDHTLTLTVTAPTLGYVNQPLTFTAEPSGVVDVIEDSLVYSWNYGDLSTDGGKENMHAYQFPGKYVVTLTASFARHTATVRHEVTILPVQFSLTRNRDGDVQISNDAPYEIDISGYTIAGAEHVSVPDGTILLPNNTITIPRERIEDGYHSMIALYDGAKQLVASALPYSIAPAPVAIASELKPVTLASAAGQTQPMPQITPVAARTSFEPPSSFTFLRDVEPDREEKTVVTQATTSRTSVERDDVVANVASVVPQDTEHILPYLALIALLSVAIVGLYVGRKKTDEESRNQKPSKVVLFDDYD